jgi:hypothetical protein
VRGSWWTSETHGAHADTRLFPALAHGRVGGLLAGIDDARHALPCPVVRPLPEEHLLVLEHHGCHADQRQRRRADLLAQ